MQRVMLIAALALGACTAGESEASRSQAPDTPPAATAEPDRKLAEPSADFPEPEFYAPDDSRDLDDTIAGCPHMNPETRPRGSNCFGIFPEQCGADKAARYVEHLATPDVRREIVSFSPSGDVRFIEPGQAVIEDLRYGRLNILLDANNRITKVDCY